MRLATAPRVSRLSRYNTSHHTPGAVLKHTHNLAEEVVAHANELAGAVDVSTHFKFGPRIHELVAAGLSPSGISHYHRC